MAPFHPFSLFTTISSFLVFLCLFRLVFLFRGSSFIVKKVRFNYLVNLMEIINTKNRKASFSYTALIKIPVLIGENVEYQM